MSGHSKWANIKRRKAAVDAKKGAVYTKIGREQVASAVAAGLIVGLTGMVSSAALRQAVAARAPRGTAELNVRAVAEGLGLAEGPSEARRRRPCRKRL